MTARQLFEYALIELNKVQAPSLLLEDYNYFINKAVSQYINKVYNLYDINQQKTDDLRVLKSSAVLQPRDHFALNDDSLFGLTKEVDLPDDYLHILNCVVEYTVQKTFKCYNADSRVHFGAKRLTADMFSQIINNYYMRPSYKSPYYYINNVNINNVDASGHSSGHSSSQFPVKSNLEDNAKQVVISKIAEGDETFNAVEREPEQRFGNKSKVRMEIRYGKDANTFQLSKVYIDYLKAPQHIRLTQDQVDTVEDTSQLLEFPDYICQEIVNELIKLLMENASDPRLQTSIPINQTIANPAQEQEQRKR